jgi:hypothetical protein
MISCALAVPLLALNLQAQVTDGWRGANHTPTNILWSVPSNWSLGRVPYCISTNITGDKASFNSGTQPPCIVNSLALPSQFVIGDGNGNWGNVIIANGGSLTSSNFSGVNSWNALGYSMVARVDIRPGGSLISSNHLWIGFNWNARGHLEMNGGTATVLGMIGLGGFGGTGGGIGLVQVNGGSLNLAQWNDAQSISPLSQLDIRGGTVVITNDHSASIANYIAGGQITGYGGVGTVNYLVTTNATSTQTVLTATCPVGAGGPYPVTNGQPTVETTFPTNINPNLFVHYWATNPPATPPNANWINCLDFVNAGDQATTDVTFRGLGGKQSAATYFNIRDYNWTAWNTNGLVDVLLCVYGDASVLRSALDPNQCKRFRFEVGNSPTDSSSRNFSWHIPTNLFNSQWNWVLFTITNNFQSNIVDRLMGSLRTNAPTGTSTNYGGVNGGTMRIDTLDGGALGLSIRAVAFGQHGAFGTAPDINQFVPPDGSCPPVLDVNLVGVDINAGTSNHLQVINDPGTGQDVTFLSNVGPVDDKRNAVAPNGYYLNFGIVSNYLGQPCNDNAPMKVCVDYYDDPSFAGLGVMFGPYTYATDNLGDTATLPSSSLVTLQGTGRWIRQSWTIHSVNLYGVSTAPLTGGPQFVSINGQVAVSRCEIAVLRSTGPLAGQDPLAGCYQDPNICLGIYANYAELDLANGITNGVDLGNNSGDQTYVVEMAGPAGDQRLSVRVDSPLKNYGYFNLQVVTNSMGPASQGNVYLAIALTYYDDPASAGLAIRPEVWYAQQFGAPVETHMSNARNIVLQGTDKWRDAYWEIAATTFDGVNQHPAPPRFTISTNVHICRFQYAAVRPCGSTAGQNVLRNPLPLSAGPDAGGQVRVSWPYEAPQVGLQGEPTLGGIWSAFPGTPAVENGTNVVLRFTPSADSQFFRLNLTPQ